MATTAEGNEAQAAFWSELGGDAWVRFQDQMDRQLGDVGAAALHALDAAPGESVLDIGCGCGATTMDLAAAVGPTGRVVGVDISAPMTELATQRLRDRRFGHARTIVADAQIVAPAEIGGPVDAAFSRFGVMFFGDPVAAFTNIRALVKPSGRIAFVCWQDASNNRLFGDMAREMAAIFPALSPPDPRAPGPLAFADPEYVRTVLGNAGWTGVAIESHRAPMQLFGTDDFELALQGSLFVGGVSRFLNGADEATTTKIHAAVRRVLESQWSENGAIVESGTWIVSAHSE